MTVQNVGFKVLGLALMAGLVGSPGPVLAGAAQAAVSGTLLAATARSPIAGAKVYAGDPATGRVFASSPSDESGQFQIAALPPGAYELAVESGGGLFVVASPVALAAGPARQLQIVVPEPANRAQATGHGVRNGVMDLWSNPLTASLIVVGSAFVVGAIVENATDDDDEPDLSPN